MQKRGDFLAPGEAVEPDVFAFLPPLPIKGRPANRLDLARWLVSADNPLTPRVVVNRLWQQYFGKGLVETENDFGMQGRCRRIRNCSIGWPSSWSARLGPKDMHRLIVTSATYRQSSQCEPELAKDADNRLLARQNRLRLEAEIIRDAALTASGLLSRKIGGPGVYPPQPPGIFAFTQSTALAGEQGPRPLSPRHVHVHLAAEPASALDDVRRSRRPGRLHAPQSLQHAAAGAAPGQRSDLHRDGPRPGRAHHEEGPADDAGRIDYAFRLCFCRAPTDASARGCCSIWSSSGRVMRRGRGRCWRGAAEPR